MEREFLTVPEVAELLRLDTETIYRLLRAGKIPGKKVGESWRIRRAGLGAFFEGAKGDNGNG